MWASFSKLDLEKERERERGESRKQSDKVISGATRAFTGGGTLWGFKRREGTR